MIINLLQSIPLELSVAAIGVISVLASGCISWKIAIKASDTEIQKLRETWDHEKELSDDNDFSDMVSKVEIFLRSQNGPNKNKAIEAINKVRTKSQGEIAVILDLLYNDITIDYYTNQESIRKNLHSAVKQKREEKGKQNT